jgi:ABC-type uncharacterized transport system YnjBCD substrate-binding protein
MMQKLDIDVEEFLAWARGTPKKVAVPQPPPNRATKTFSITVQSRDVVVLPQQLFSNVRSPPLDRK